MSKLESLINRYTYIKKQWLNSAGTSEQSQCEKQMEQILGEMKKWQASHSNNARTTDADKVTIMYHLYENGLKTPENTKEA